MVYDEDMEYAPISPVGDEGPTEPMEPEIITEPVSVASQPSQERVTTPYLTKYERARILGARALQISLNAPVLVEVDKETDPLEIAEKELIAKKIPFTIRRYLPDGSYEDWHLNDLITETS
ncbi:hypothetical protein P9112_004702 [Eukaryota sp. TZLM1-RC]